MRSTRAGEAVFLLFSIVWPGFLCPQQAGKIADCAKLVAAGQKRDAAKNLEHSLDLSAPGGARLVYLGAEHSRDPGDPQFQAFERAWDDLEPTLAFYEGTGTSIAASRNEAIRTGGEPGLVRFLAKRDGVAMTTLEPERQDEIAFLLETFSPEQIKLFYVLRVVAELREREKVSPDDLQKEVQGILDQFSRYRGLESILRNVSELEAAYRRNWKTPKNWWEAPAGWFDPLVPSTATGGIFTNEINRASSHYRDVHMFEVLAAAARKGERVFAVVGRDHVPMQAAALKCAIR
jgi:hypothetical protein